MNKKLKIILISVVFILSIFFIFIRTLNTPERIIKNYIKYNDTHNMDKLNKCVAYRISTKSIEDIKNIKHMKLIDIELVNDESIYNTYMHSGSGALRDDLSRNHLKIYKVKYDIKYKDDNKSVNGSGEYTKKYFLIKENDTGKWIIDDIGQ